MAITILSGMRLTPARLNALAPASARRATDATVTNSTTLVDGLSVPVLANAEYDVEAMMIYEATVTGDMRVAFNWPSGSMTWGLIGLSTQATAFTGDGTFPAFGAPAVDNALLVGATGLGGQLTALARGTLVTGGSAGNLRLRFAQATAAAATSAVLKAGSTLQVRRIA